MTRLSTNSNCKNLMVAISCKLHLKKSCSCKKKQRIFSAAKVKNFIRKFIIYSFLIFAQNIDCEYTLEPAWRVCSNEHARIKIKKNMYAPEYPSFTIVKYVRDKRQQTPSVEKHAHPPRVVYCAI